MADRGIVLARDSLQLVPLSRPDPGRLRILSVTYARRADLGAGNIFNAELRKAGGGVIVDARYVNADDAAPNLKAVIAAADSADVIVLGTYVNISSTTASASMPPAFQELVSGLQAGNGRLVLLAFGSPYVLQAVPSVSTLMIAWGGSPVSQRAAARALTGEIPITATLPISIPPFLPFGAGERRPAR
jgi:hypothetical protein